MELKPAPCPFRVAYDQVGDLHRCTGCFGDAFGKSSVKLADDLGPNVDASARSRR